MGLQCILLWFLGRFLPGIIMLRQIPNGKIPLHFFVRGATSLPHILNTDDRLSSIIWAVVLACHGATTHFAGLLTVRILLGIFESTIGPGLSLITSMWYKRSEHASRHGIWFAGNSISSVFGGLLTYGIGHISNSVEPWRVRGPASSKHSPSICFPLNLI